MSRHETNFGSTGGRVAYNESWHDVDESAASVHAEMARHGSWGPDAVIPHS